jgi:hypothetical protein
VGTILLGLMLGVCSAVSASGQTLGDIARIEAERRNQQAQAGKVYTNEDLDPTATPSAPAEAAPAATSPAPQRTVTGPNGVVMKEDPAKGTININAPPAASSRDEKYWRRRSKDMRESLARTRANIAATQQRLSVLEASPQTAGTAHERGVLTTTLKQLQAEEAMRNADIAQLRTFAASQNVPPAWLELD